MQKGITILISSHLLDELSKIVTKYGIINDGVLIEEVSAEELQEKCTQKLIFTVSDTEKAVSLLSEEVSAKDIRVEENQIYLFSHLEEAATLNRLLVQQGVDVSGLQVQADGLEQYFMKRIGG